jgi:glycosyltransferase involved in cell wall biosynthesis
MGKTGAMFWEQTLATDRKPVVTIVATYDGDYFLPLRLIEAYRSFGYQVAFVGWDRLGNMPRRRMVDRVPYEYIMRGWGYANWKLAIALPLWTLRLAFHMATIRTDLVHAIDFDAALGVSLGLRLLHVPFLYDIQDNFDLRHSFPIPVRRIIQALNQWIIKRSARTIVVGEDRIVGDMARYLQKIAAIPNCPPEVAPPAGLVKDEENLTLAAVGRIAASRGIGLLLEACRRLPWLRVIMAGHVEDEELGQALRACPQIELHGYMAQEKALELVYRSDASFAFYDPSTEICRRANGAKWYDAMMVGRPILVNNEVMSAEWIEREGIGYASPYADTDGFVRMLTYLHEHRVDMEEKGSCARKLYETQFNRKAMDKRLLFVVQEVMSGSLGSRRLLGPVARRPQDQSGRCL